MVSDLVRQHSCERGQLMSAQISNLAVTRVEWCDVPGTKFLLGSTESPDEQPIIEVELSHFQIGRTPVTNAQYAAFIAAGGYARRELWHPLGFQHAKERAWTEPNYWRDPNSGNAF